MSKRLITDRDVATGAVRPPLVLGGDTLITPSARDRAAQLGWAIVEDGAAVGATTCVRCGRGGCAGGCTNCGASGGASVASEAGGAVVVPGSGSARLDALADGLYLVRIEGGQMISALPASGPGLMQRAEGARRAVVEAGNVRAGDARGGRA